MSPPPGIVPGTQQVLKICWAKNKWTSSASLRWAIHPCDTCECLHPQTGVCPSRVGLQHLIQAGRRLCSLVCLSRTSRPAAQTAEPTAGACRGLTQNLPVSARQFSTPGGIELRPRSFLAPPDVGITRLDVKPKRVRASRWEESWEERAPLPLPLCIWVAAL